MDNGLLNVDNSIWESDHPPSSWHEAVIIRIAESDREAFPGSVKLSGINSYHFQEKCFRILISFNLSKSNMKYHHYILAKVLELHNKLTRYGREITFVWLPGHVDSRGNSTSDSAAEDAHDGNISDELIPFLDLKIFVNNIFGPTCFSVGVW